MPSVKHDDGTLKGGLRLRRCEGEHVFPICQEAKAEVHLDYPSTDSAVACTYRRYLQLITGYATIDRDAGPARRLLSILI